VLPDRFDLSSADAVRTVLDRYDIGGRLQYIREFVWRGGALDLRVSRGSDGQMLNVWYALRAEWPAAVLERENEPASQGLVSWRSPVVEGRWVRGTNRYELRVGIDLCVASAIYIRSQGFDSHVPFLGRHPEQVEHALNAELSTYMNAFLDHFQPVPQAADLEAQRLSRLAS
jgi:hypothetical protein